MANVWAKLGLDLLLGFDFLHWIFSSFSKQIARDVPEALLTKQPVMFLNTLPPPREVLVCSC